MAPVTLLSWHRRLVEGGYTSTHKVPGRPSTSPAVEALVMGMARDNSCWGRRRIRGELFKLGHRSAPSTHVAERLAGG